jgi:hypothetical protein
MPRERPILQGFAFLAAGNAHGTTASGLAISFAPRVVEHLGTNTRASPILFSNYRQNMVFAEIVKSIPQTFSDSQQQLGRGQ